VRLCRARRESRKLVRNLRDTFVCRAVSNPRGKRVRRNELINVRSGAAVRAATVVGPELTVRPDINACG
jgi:hypothetical protein